MKKIMLPLLAIGALAVMALKPVTNDPLPIGSALPKADIKMTDVNGKSLTLQQAKKSNGLLVIFSCNSCPVVIKNQARNNEICAFAEKNNIGVVIVNSNEGNREGSESPEAMKEYAQEQSYQWTYAVDKNSELADAFGASRTPECFLFDKNSKLAYHGAIDDNPGNASAVSRQHLHVAISEMAAGKDISIKTSRSVGCGIKRKG